jgi:hypothetical protein
MGIMTEEGCMEEGASIDGVVVGTKEELGEVLGGLVGARRSHRGNNAPSTGIAALEPLPL